MRMNMSDFATFFAVARNQSFRAAGDELGLSSSAISHSIKTLEQRLKIRLFNRTTRSVSLTEAGSNLYERLRPAFDEIQIMLDEMNDFRLTPTGTLKINAARVAARIFLMSYWLVSHVNILILKSSSQLTTLLSISSNRALTLAFDLVASSKKI
ncbi:LysR family transcriptional regulator [Escherichia coli]|nr:LysR family transcriptional regulator [Escherichia coli]